MRWHRRLLVRNLAVLLLLLPRWWKLAGSAGKENGESVEQCEMQHSGGGGGASEVPTKIPFHFCCCFVYLVLFSSRVFFSCTSLRCVSKADDCSPPYSAGPPWRGDSIGATENAGFSAKLQRNLGLDFVM